MATFCGDKVRAAHAGTVLAAGRHFDDHLGWVGDLSAYYARLDKKKLWTTLPIVVVIDDGNGYRSVYAHFGKVVVKTGQVVKAGRCSATKAGPAMRPAATSTTACSARSRRRRSRSIPASPSG